MKILYLHQTFTDDPSLHSFFQTSVSINGIKKAFMIAFLNFLKRQITVTEQNLLKHTVVLADLTKGQHTLHIDLHQPYVSEAQSSENCINYSFGFET